MSELLIINDRLEKPVDSNITVTLPFELRQKSRLRVKLDDGREAGLMLSRGQILRGGDSLRAEDGTVINVTAADEAVTTVTHTRANELARAAYHLGNRHVALQVGDGWLRYLADHVLDEMVVSLGFDISHENAPFEPENGAYHSHGSSQTHSHSHGHTHAHDDHDQIHDKNHDHDSEKNHNHIHQV